MAIAGEKSGQEVRNLLKQAVDAAAAPDAPRPDPPGADEEKALDKVKDVLEALVAANEKRAPAEGIWYFFSSGVFFMIVGAALLGVAYYTHFQAHSSFTFILVVIGVAILLYGTGTQGAGNFDGAVGAARYRVGLAGGAGILAFCVAMGIVLKAPEIQRAFQIERKYVQLVFRGRRDGISDLTGYVSDVMIDGIAVPTFRFGNSIVAFVPFVGGDDDRKVDLSATFYYVGPEGARNKALLPRLPHHEELQLRSLWDVDMGGGGDFPRYPEPVAINMVAESVQNDPDAGQRAGVGHSVNPPGLDGPPAALTLAE